MDEIPYIDGASSSNSAGKAKATLTKNGDFFIESTFVVFEVENQLFRVPSYMFFKESPTFVETFDLALSAENHGDTWPGMNSENPIVLPDDVRCQDFENLLKALYPRSVALRLSLSKAEWVSILKLSTKWQFLDLRKLAKSELEVGKELSSVEKIVLGREFYTSSWVLAGYEELAQKADTMTDDEAIDIELPTAINLCRIREIMLRQSLTLALHALKNVFAEELSTICGKEIKYRTEQERALAEDEMRREEERREEEMRREEEKRQEEARWGEVEVVPERKKTKKGTKKSMQYMYN